jgi:hypothetical protein
MRLHWFSNVQPTTVKCQSSVRHNAYSSEWQLQSRPTWSCLSGEEGKQLAASVRLTPRGSFMGTATPANLAEWRTGSTPPSPHRGSLTCGHLWCLSIYWFRACSGNWKLKEQDRPPLWDGQWPAPALETAWPQSWPLIGMCRPRKLSHLSRYLTHLEGGGVPGKTRCCPSPPVSESMDLGWNGGFVLPNRLWVRPWVSPTLGSTFRPIQGFLWMQVHGDGLEKKKPDWKARV